MTTIASVWTHAQFIDSAQIKGHALGLRIAAGNVPNFVDLATGGWGGLIQDWLNSSQTPDHGQFRHSGGRSSSRLRNPRDAGRPRRAAHGGNVAQG